MTRWITGIAVLCLSAGVASAQPAIVAIKATPEKSVFKDSAWNMYPEWRLMPTNGAPSTCTSPDEGCSTPAATWGDIGANDTNIGGYVVERTVVQFGLAEVESVR